MFPDGRFLFARPMFVEGTMTLVLDFSEERKANMPR
jgi:hypothetical protein